MIIRKRSLFILLWFIISGFNVYPQDKVSIPPTPISPGLRVFAFISKESGTILNAHERLLYVVVLDQLYHPVPDATIEYTTHIEQGQERRYIIPNSTNQNGITMMRFNIGEYPENQVIEINLHAYYHGLHAETRAAFWNWY